MRSGLPLFDRPKPSIETTEKEMEMADTAFQIQYRQETIAGFEQRQSYLRSTVVTEAEIKGNQARFLVADSGAATAVTRGTNGKIPSRTDNLTTATATLVEWHDKPVKTGFNIFASQGDGKRIMQDTTVGVMNRKIDSDIITTLATATQYAGLTALPASFSTIAYALALLGNNDIDTEDVDNLFFIMTPSFYSYIIQAPEWASRDFVDMQPLVGPMKRYTRFAGFNCIVNGNLTNKGTSSEICYAYHRSAIGHAANTEEMVVEVGYDKEDDYSYARTTMYMGSALLQNAGVVKIRHDGSAFAATA
jgi:hypothetical protein